MGVLSRGGWIGGISLGGGYAGADFEEDGNALYLQGIVILVSAIVSLIFRWDAIYG